MFDKNLLVSLCGRRRHAEISTWTFLLLLCQMSCLPRMNWKDELISSFSQRVSYVTFVNVKDFSKQLSSYLFDLSKCSWGWTISDDKRSQWQRERTLCSDSDCSPSQLTVRWRTRITVAYTSLPSQAPDNKSDWMNKSFVRDEGGDSLWIVDTQELLPNGSKALEWLELLKRMNEKFAKRHM